MSKVDTEFHWQGRHDSEDGRAGIRWHQAVNNSGTTAGTSLVGFACDLGVKQNKGRPGADKGPNHLRSALSNLAWHGSSPLKDVGNIQAETSLDKAQTRYAKKITEQLQQNHLVIGLGGGHEIAWGSFQGLAGYVPERKRIGIINFDAHFDLRKPSPNASSGTPFRQIAEYSAAHGKVFNYSCLGIARPSNTRALFDYAQQVNTRYLLDHQCDEAQTKQLLEPFLQEIDVLYLTVCLDVFNGSVAPGVSSPAAFGISIEYVINILHWLAQCQQIHDYNWCLADVAELNPVFDVDNRTARLAARLIHEMVMAKESSL